MSRRHSKYTALAWEQGIVTGSISAVVLAVYLLFLGFAMTLFFIRSMKWEDAAGVSEAACLGTLIMAMLTSITRQNVEGELALDFDPRLRRLPMKTMPLVTLVFGVRCASMALLALVLPLLHWANFHKAPNSDVLLVLCEGYLVLQTLVWVRQSITGVEYAVPLGLFLGACAGTLMHRQFVDNVVALLATPQSLLAVLVLCYLVSLAGLSLLRRDARVGLPKVGEVREGLAGLLGAQEQPYRSALAAQIWYERQRAGWLMLLSWAALTALASMFWYVFMNMPMAYQWLPYTALLGAVLPAGAIIVSTGHGPTFSRPIATRHLALAKLIALAQTLAIALLLACVVSSVEFLLAKSVVRELAQSAWSAGETDLLALLAWLLGPALLAGWVCWLACFVRLPSTLLLVIGSLVLTWLVYANTDFHYGSERILGPAFAMPVVLGVAIPLAAFWRAARKGLLPMRALERAAMLVLLGLGFAGAYAFTKQFDLGFLWFGLGLGAVAAMPAASLTTHLHRQRHH